MTAQHQSSKTVPKNLWKLISKAFTDGRFLEGESFEGHMDEVRVLETRNLCWSESHSSQEHRRGEAFNMGTGTSQVGLPRVRKTQEKVARSAEVDGVVCCFLH